MSPCTGSLTILRPGILPAAMYSATIHWVASVQLFSTTSTDQETSVVSCATKHCRTRSSIAALLYVQITMSTKLSDDNNEDLLPDLSAVSHELHDRFDQLFTNVCLGSTKVFRKAAPHSAQRKSLADASPGICTPCAAQFRIQQESA